MVKNKMLTYYRLSIIFEIVKHLATVPIIKTQLQSNRTEYRKYHVLNLTNSTVYVTQRFNAAFAGTLKIPILSLPEGLND